MSFKIPQTPEYLGSLSDVEQKYCCEKCGLESSIYYRKHEDVLTVLFRIQDDHRKKSSDCVFDNWKIRVI